MNLEKLEDDFYVTDENVDELLKEFDSGILDALQIYCDYYEVITGLTVDAKSKYVFCVTLELLAR